MLGDRTGSPPGANGKLTRGLHRFIQEKLVGVQLIEFRDSTSGELVDVGTVKFDLDMNMSGMVMHSGATIAPTGTPGQYRAQVKPDMGGDWMATLHYAGSHGEGSTSFSVNVKQ